MIEIDLKYNHNCQEENKTADAHQIIRRKGLQFIRREAYACCVEMIVLE